MTKEEFQNARKICEKDRLKTCPDCGSENCGEWQMIFNDGSRILLPKALDEIERLKEILDTRRSIRMKCLKCGETSVVSNSCKCGGVREEWKKDRSCK